ncbi:MAG: hypothetical protein LiPW15_716 [Parcubacteria group bacterium LiPW_15]|nr:MAG: hypothetical protein LiPW15_716 [Parcubacteria group bacterium LiPW_15]
MFNHIDNFLNRITMYRLVLYYLSGLLGFAVIFSAAGILPHNPLSLLTSAALMLIISYAVNFIFVRVFEAHDNTESVYITALILALIIVPPATLFPLDTSVLPILIWAPIFAMASKFIFAIGKKHLFNPAALAVALTALVVNQSATWWVGRSLSLSPLIFFGGLLIVRKIQREGMIAAFFIAAATSIVLTTSGIGDPLVSLGKAALYTPTFFFAFVMLTEPLTTPPTRVPRLIYGVLVGALFASNINILGVYFTPEVALLVGNVFSYFVSPKWKEVLRLKEVKEIGADIYDFVFTTDKKINFRPGQYLEWTLKGEKPDSRGNRRYFTLASSPTENEIRMGVKFYPKPSSFKKYLSALKPGDTIAASNLAGDFILPGNKNKKLVFIAGGIGVTPFRSMIKYLLDRNEKRDITIIYSAKSPKEFAYMDIFEEAKEKLGIKTIYCISDSPNVPEGWAGPVGIVDMALIVKEVPDFKDRTFYVSGPRSMTTSFEDNLKKTGVPGRRIRVDFFPGFA